MIGLPIVVIAAQKGFLVPKRVWDFEDKSKWEDDWKASIDTGAMVESKMSLVKHGLHIFLLP